jgi:hypothetical protein
MDWGLTRDYDWVTEKGDVENSARVIESISFPMARKTDQYRPAFPWLSYGRIIILSLVQYIVLYLTKPRILPAWNHCRDGGINSYRWYEISVHDSSNCRTMTEKPTSCYFPSFDVFYALRDWKTNHTIWCWWKWKIHSDIQPLGEKKCDWLKLQKHKINSRCICFFKEDC